MLNSWNSIYYIQQLGYNSNYNSIYYENVYSRFDFFFIYMYKINDNVLTTFLGLRKIKITLTLNNMYTPGNLYF